jgi:hypothetical protein
LLCESGSAVLSVVVFVFVVFVVVVFVVEFLRVFVRERRRSSAREKPCRPRQDTIFASRTESDDTHRETDRRPPEKSIDYINYYSKVILLEC